jgi:DNA-binding MurR/RpiR family transcriptional regulator
MASHINTSNPINALIAIYNFGNYKSGDKDVAQALLANLRRVPDCTIESLAGLCNVSVSTFQRFYKYIGYKSFSEFKIKITDALSSHLEKNTHISIDRQPGENSIDALFRQAIESVTLVGASLDHVRLLALATELQRYKRIYIHDTYFSSAKLFLQGDLALDGKKVSLSLYTEQQQRDLAEFDATCFLLAFCGRSARYREIEFEIPAARKKGACIGVICLAPVFRYADACDHLLLCKGTGSSLDMLAADLIFTALSTTYRENCL